MLGETLAAFVATIGFGILFNIKGKKLIFAGIDGAIGWFVYKFILILGLSQVSALFIASISISIFSEVYARVLKTPVTTFIVCALIPLVPGGGMYYTMVEAITGNIMESLETGINTLASAGSLALGIICVSTVTRIIMSYNNSKSFKFRHSRHMKL
ncbi:threonine/serine exporter family protein [Clostridium septicum]|uniref:Threonine/serine exporter n=1 Tax=Clostridium septicum TaxID=1504 RepID=A0A9N7PHQ6_CLOSE|nr:threonine/serine exporter family protein [Clostridium septicum]AYE33011.1 threonine/serine exporter [Clostridium septicum]MDU1313404.1 threonine/serine exporter family protein [Clostridium septicum]QAS61180.1 threonine/serine exporter [Clostridium septicum]UEC19472.1 threonine/serine exporter family protein [Clostridium septicum]USR99575.1 threonine/serine exporter family protein [Clostridium septicum]